MTERTTDTAPPAIGGSDWLSFGLNQVAYIRPVLSQNGLKQYGVFSADGTPLHVSSGYAGALMAIKSSDMEHVSLH